MKKGIREVRDHFTRYLKQVRAGKTIIITDRGEPVAQLSAVTASQPLETRLEHLERQGFLRLAKNKGPLPRLQRGLPKRGPLLRELVVRERDEGL